MRRSRGLLSFGLAAAVLFAGPAAVAGAAGSMTSESADTIAAETGGVTGTVTEVRDDRVRIMDATTNRPVEFVINSETAVEGTVKVGSVVEVSYRDDGGNKTAVSIKVIKS